MVNKGLLDPDYIENIVEKGEIAHFEQYHLFPQCFPKAFSLQCVKMNIYGVKGLSKSGTERMIEKAGSFSMSDKVNNNHKHIRNI